MIVKGNPGISILITSESKASSIHYKTVWDAKLISSNKSGWPYLNAFKKCPSWDEIPTNEFLSPTIFPNKSVSEDKLNLNKLFVFAIWKCFWCSWRSF